jgi:NAD(P)-dependent dehydrogenase (short-subunit alcohol dehydrogenase family)
MTGMTYRLIGTTALVTGGAGGIGRACAELLRDNGAQVYAADLVPGEKQDGITPVTLDVSDAEALAGFIGEAESPIQICVNNAAVYHAREGLEVALGDWRKSFSIIVESSITSSAAIARRLCRDGLPGAIVNISSIAGFLGNTNQVDYCAAKSAVIGLTRAAALDLVGDGITVNAVCPGSVDTPMIRRVADRIAAMTGVTHDDAIGQITRDIPQKRLQEPSEIAHGVAFLASTAARAITGQTLVIDGGQSVAI